MPTAFCTLVISLIPLVTYFPCLLYLLLSSAQYDLHSLSFFFFFGWSLNRVIHYQSHVHLHYTFLVPMVVSGKFPLTVSGAVPLALVVKEDAPHYIDVQ